MASENGHLKVIARTCVGLAVFTNIVHQVVEELLAAGAKLDPLVFDSYLLPLHMAINKVTYLPQYFLQEQMPTCTNHNVLIGIIGQCVLFRVTLPLPNC